MIRFLAHFLVILVAWTLTIKFLFPLAYDLMYRVPIGTHIYWDFWWIIHLYLAFILINWRTYSWNIAVCVSVVEISIIVIKFLLFLHQPDWTIWSVNWFVNKLFVLTCFSIMLSYF